MTRSSVHLVEQQFRVRPSRLAVPISWRGSWAGQSDKRASLRGDFSVQQWPRCAMAGSRRHSIARSWLVGRVCQDLPAGGCARTAVVPPD